LTLLCLDASVAIKLVLGGESLRAHARQLYADAAVAAATLIAPPVFESEVDSIVRARASSGRLSAVDAERAYSAIDRLVIEIRNPSGLRQRSREIAASFNQERVYDSTYAALAEISSCEFWTADRAFHDAVKDDLPFVRFLADYPLPDH
jgi:predicted nucleic acid-binding protein